MIAEVDSIAKGLKGFKGGGTEDYYYYDRIKELFSDKNKEAIKRLKEDLVNDILGTMAEGLENLVIFKTKTVAGVVNIDENKKRQLLKFISIIKDIDNLEQEHIDSLILNDGLKGLPYIYKITTLVMINMFKKVHKSRYTSPQLEETPFKYLANTKFLIAKITAEYNGENRNVVLKGLTEEVKSGLMYYNYIYILNNYDATKGDDNDARRIIEWMKEKCKEIENNEFKRFIETPFLIRNDFVTGCKKNLVLNKAIDEYNTIIKDIREIYSSLDVFPKKEEDVPKYNEFINSNNAITSPEMVSLLSTKGLLYSGNLYELYGYIIHYEDKMKSFLSLKKNYIVCVKEFYGDNIIAEYELKETLDEKNKNEYMAANIPDNIIRGLEGAVSRITESLGKIYLLQQKSKNLDFYNNIPIDIGEIVNEIDKLCAYNDAYIHNKDEITQKIEEFKARNEADVKEEATAETRYKKALAEADAIALAGAKAKAAEEKEEPYEMVTDEGYVNSLNYTGNNSSGGKLTTKYISTGNFVYILYEKKKIKRCVYAKAKGRGKYCKIKGDYILVSKLKVV